MSELIQKHDNRATIRWKLLTGVSALALTVYVSSTALARAEDADRPLIWLDLGGQAEIMQGLNSPFTAGFMSTPPIEDAYPQDIFLRNQRPPRFAFGFDGKISFQPGDSPWIFSAGIRYGRAHTNRHQHQQGARPLGLETNIPNPVPYPIFAAPFADVAMREDESHAILDFQAGKDVGLGRLGHNIDSTISAGVRFAQFSTTSSVDISARPHISSFHRTGVGFHIPRANFFQYFLSGEASRSFKGVGPSLSWNASAPIAGNAEDGELSLDWGINGAVLFGRQRAKVGHATQTYHQYTICTSFKPTHVICKNTGKFKSRYVVVNSTGNSDTRSRRVTMPNIGGFAALTARFKDAKVSIGYRYDTFLKAMDTGIDATKKSNLTFNGPYASISIGLGD